MLFRYRACMGDRRSSPPSRALAAAALPFLVLLPGTARADGMGVGAEAVILVGAAVVGATGFYIACAVVAGLALRALQGKPRRAVRSVLGLLSIVVALPGVGLSARLIVSEIVEALTRPGSTPILAAFALPPFAMSALTGVLGVALLRQQHAAPEARGASPSTAPSAGGAQ